MLLDEIRSLAAGTYPFHMPGHKRRLVPDEALADWYALDLTEIGGADDLHDADGILRAAMERTSALWGSRRTWYLTGGSTVGILAAVRALAPAGSRILIAANCHRSVWHAAEIGMLRVRRLLPEIDPRAGICGSVEPDRVREALAGMPDCRAVVVTSPTYEGVVSDIRGIAEVCHAAGVPLIVDEAHGAHLGFCPGFPDSALHCGADLVVQSAHKTLPAPTQTAFLHLGREALPSVSEEAVARQLDVFETSSPSYPMMGALDAVTAMLETRGQDLFRAWREALDAFDRKISGLRSLRVVCHGADNLDRHPGFYAFDPGKILVSGRDAGLTGPDLMEICRGRFSVEGEMALGDSVLFMTGCGDDWRYLDLLAEDLCLLDRELTEAGAGTDRDGGADGRRDYLPIPRQEEELCPGQVLLEPAVCVPREEAAGGVSGEYVYAYPPGIPLLAPGDPVTEEVLSTIRQMEARGTRIHRTGSGPDRCLCILTKGTAPMYHDGETDSQQKEVQP